MTARNRFHLIMICFTVLIAGTLLIKQTASSEQRKIETIGIDYAQMNQSVEKVLKDMPEMVEELTSIQSGIRSNKLESSFSTNKTEFRLRVNNNLTGEEHSSPFLKGIAEKQTDHYQDALEIAEEAYGITVTEDEIDAYIKENVSTVWDAEKRKYAKSLQLTLNELDYYFDRDVYVMNVLWERVLPLVMQEFPRERGESGQAYGKRIKEEFFTSMEDEA
ncbi:hypothetical protein CSV69_16185 [Sporosarcina sp. P26b]|uniref:hypothetical protein n=1 Tax=Sporosarcina TaxID=1569 RepID=UPI000A17EACD|nr:MULTISPECIES: hypothetical protein [Sporosarcina]ARK21853.1 hypothetical protein SporoP32a_10155 [Sporosarcina ureae]PIC73512.1 hypothetical protein CSV76_08780 [Sporosarcina sp. P17b]PIC94549.1 hypothetical protein CSV69_16185 [Sporosarcina sp. P26b]